MPGGGQLDNAEILEGGGGAEVGVECVEDVEEDGVVEGGRGRFAGAEAVARRVLGDASLAGGGAGPGGFLGVGAVGLDLSSRRHWDPLLPIITDGWKGGEGGGVVSGWGGRG